jgi:hypothetical protein
MKTELIQVLNRLRYTLVSNEELANEMFKAVKIAEIKQRKELNDLDFKLRQSKMFCETIPKPNIDSLH